MNGRERIQAEDEWEQGKSKSICLDTNAWVIFIHNKFKVNILLDFVGNEV